MAGKTLRLRVNPLDFALMEAAAESCGTTVGAWAARRLSVAARLEGEVRGDADPATREWQRVTSRMYGDGED